MTPADPVTPRTWAPEEIATLRQMWEDGASTAAIAEKLGRSYDAVSTRRKVLKLTSRRRLAWTPAEDELLRQLVAEGLGPKLIAARMHRDDRRISERTKVLGIRRTVERKPRPPVSQEHEHALRTLAAEKLSSSAIAQRLGIPRGTVLSRCRRLGIKLLPGVGCRPAPVRRGAGRRNNNPTGFNGLRAGTPVAPTPVAMPPCEPRVSIMDVRHGQCRWPGGMPEIITADTPVFCGAPAAAGKSYCPGHLAMCTVPAVRPRG